MAHAGLDGRGLPCPRARRARQPTRAYRDVACARGIQLERTRKLHAARCTRENLSTATLPVRHTPPRFVPQGTSRKGAWGEWARRKCEKRGNGGPLFAKVVTSENHAQLHDRGLPHAHAWGCSTRRCCNNNYAAPTTRHRASPTTCLSAAPGAVAFGPKHGPRPEAWPMARGMALGPKRGPRPVKNGPGPEAWPEARIWKTRYSLIKGQRGGHTGWVGAGTLNLGGLALAPTSPTAPLRHDRPA